MNALHSFRRRPLPVLLAVGTATVAMAVSASGGTAGTRAAVAATAIAAPSVNGDYLYGQLYTMSKSFSYRISGADGDPRNPADPFNIPPTVNGWQELYAFWKKALTNQQANTPLAGF